MIWDNAAKTASNTQNSVKSETLATPTIISRIRPARVANRPIKKLSQIGLV